MDTLTAVLLIVFVIMLTGVLSWCLGDFKGYDQGLKKGYDQGLKVAETWRKSSEAFRKDNEQLRSRLGELQQEIVRYKAFVNYLDEIREEHGV